jgi:hypothetical protein
VALQSTSCGILLYPERRGQPPGGRLDPGVVLLDAAGLLLFVVPGLIAFAVDFSTGAIYLPPPEYVPVTQSTFRREDLVEVKVGAEELTQAKIEDVVSRRTGRSVTLEPGKFRAEELSDLDEFDEHAERLNASADPPTRVRFR